MSKSFVMGMVCALGLTVSLFAQGINKQDGVVAASLRIICFEPGICYSLPSAYYVQGVADPTEGGKVTGSGRVWYPTDGAYSLTLTASPTKGWVFTAWQDGNKTAKRVVTFDQAEAIADETGIVEYTATFLPIAELEKPVVTAVDGVVTGMVGVAFNLPVEYESLCVAAVAATKLPSGLKLKNGVISGVPKNAETVVVTLTASNPAGKSAPVPVTIRILPLPLSAQGTFTGAFMEESVSPADEPGVLVTNVVVVGTLTMTVSATGKMSAKTITDKGKVSFSAPSWATRDGVLLTAELKTKKAETLEFMLNSSYYFATLPTDIRLTGGVFEGTDWWAWAQKKSVSNKGGPATEALIETCYGYYTAAFFNREMIATGNATNTPQGYGYCTVALKVDGSVKIAGKLADGKAISASSTLLLFDWDWFFGTRMVAIPFYIPMYRQGVFSGILIAEEGANPYINEQSELVADYYPAPTLSCFSNLPARWHYPGKSPSAKPPQTQDAFKAQLGCVGSVYFSGWNWSQIYTQEMFVAEAPDLSYTYSKDGYTTGVIDAWADLLPNMPLLTSSKMTLPKKGKAVVVNKDGDYVADGANPAAATFSLAQKSGVFKGTFNAYYKYADEKGAPKLKTVPAKYEGVVLPYYAGSPSPSGAGFYQMPDVWVDRTDPAKPVTYKLNRSFGVMMLPPEDE